MTKEQKMKAFEIMLDGGTYQEAADAVGVSKQAIHAHFAKIPALECARVEKAADCCIFPNIKKHIIERRLVCTVFVTMLHESWTIDKAYCARWLKARLSGKREFSAFEWLKMSEIFGEPVEKLMEGCTENQLIYKRREESNHGTEN